MPDHRPVDQRATDHRLPADETELALDVARRYYFDDESKVAIASELGLSRFQVARLLRDARRDDLVRISIGRPGEIDRGRSATLAERLGVSRVIVVDTGGRATAAEHVGRALAGVVTESVRAGDTLGIAWSRAAVAMAGHLSTLPRCEVVQLGGAIYPPKGLPGSVEVTRSVAARADTSAHVIYAPLVVRDSSTAQGLLAQPEIAATAIRWRAVDVGVLAVGAWSAGASAVFDMLPAEAATDLGDDGVCGELSGRLVDRRGKLVRSELESRVVGASWTQLRRIPRLIVSAHGVERADATVAALRATRPQALVIDAPLAAALDTAAL